MCLPAIKLCVSITHNVLWTIVPRTGYGHKIKLNAFPNNDIRKKAHNLCSSSDLQGYILLLHKRDSGPQSLLQAVSEQRRLIDDELSQLVLTQSAANRAMDFSGIASGFFGIEEEIHLGFQVVLQAQTQDLRIRNDYRAKVRTLQAQLVKEKIEFTLQIILAQPECRGKFRYDLR